MHTDNLGSYFRNISGEEAVRQEMEGSKSTVLICGHCCGQLEPNPSGDCWRRYTTEISKPQPSDQIWHSACLCTSCKHGHHSSILALRGTETKFRCPPLPLFLPLLTALACPASGFTFLLHRACPSCHLHIGHSSVGNFWAPSIGISG